MFIHVNEETGAVCKVKDHRVLHWTDTVMATGNLETLDSKQLIRLASILIAASMEKEVSDGATETDCR